MPKTEEDSIIRSSQDSVDEGTFNQNELPMSGGRWAVIKLQEVKNEVKFLPLKKGEMGQSDVAEELSMISIGHMMDNAAIEDTLQPNEPVTIAKPKKAAKAELSAK